MLTIEKKFLYKAFGFNISSEIIMPELPLEHEYDKPNDVVIEKRDLFKVWDKLADEHSRYIIKDNIVMFKIDNTATFLIQDGRKIVVSSMVDSSEDKIRLYILGTCMGILLMQRKILPLHGSAVAIDGKAYAFVGDRGAGKSTLAAAFLNKGYQLLSDDVIAVCMNENQVPFVVPSYPQQKLWQESLDGFGMKVDDYRPLFEREKKYAIPVLNQFSSNQLPLAGIIELEKTEGNEIEIHKMVGLERLHTLFRHTYRNFLISRLGVMEWHFHQTTLFANQIDVYRIKRPTTIFSAYHLVSTILNFSARRNCT